MDERPQQARTREFLEVGAGLCESSPDALDRPDVEPLADECVQGDPGGDDVAPCVFPRELDLIEDFGFDECEFVTAARVR